MNRIGFGQKQVGAVTKLVATFITGKSLTLERQRVDKMVTILAGWLWWQFFALIFSLIATLLGSALGIRAKGNHTVGNRAAVAGSES